MRKEKLGFILGLLLATTLAFGAGTSDSEYRIGVTGVDSQTSYSGGSGIVKYNAGAGRLESSDNGVDFKPLGGGAGGSGGVNFLQGDNFDFEAGDPPTSWTNTGGGTFVSDVATPLFGGRSGVWDPSAGSDTLCSVTKDIEIGLEGNQCLARIFYKWESGVTGDIDLQARNDLATVLATLPLEKTTGIAKEAFVIFTCESAPRQVELCLSSNTNAAAITVDEAHLGSNIRSIQVSTAVHYGTLFYPITAGCLWTIAATSFGTDFTATAACPVATVSGQVIAPATKIPAARVSGSGTYVFEFDYPLIQSSGSTLNACRLLDENDTVLDGANSVTATVSNTAVTQMSVRGSISYTDSDTHTIRVQCLTGATTLQLIANSDQNELSITVDRFALDSQNAQSINASNFFVHATIEGANTNLGTGDISSATSFFDASLTLTAASISSPVDIACTTGGTTGGGVCTGSSEGLGVTVDILSTDVYESCVAFAQVMNLNAAGSSASLQTTWSQGISVSNTDSALASGGQGIVRHPVQFQLQSGNGTSDNVAPAIRFCDYFLLSAGLNTLRLYATQTTGGTVNGSLLLMDGLGGSSGGRNLSWTIQKSRTSSRAIQLDNLTTSANASGTEEAYCRVEFPAGAPTVVEDPQGMCATLVDVGLGRTTVTFPVNLWANTPICNVTANGIDEDLTQAIEGTPSTTSVGIQTKVSAASADRQWQLHCSAAK